VLKTGKLLEHEVVNRRGSPAWENGKVATLITGREKNISGTSRQGEAGREPRFAGLGKTRRGGNAQASEEGRRAAGEN